MNKFGHFLVVVQLIHRPTQADISCTTMSRMFFLPLLALHHSIFKIFFKTADCVYGPWIWNPCPVTCGDSIRTAHRSIESQPLGEGAACNGPFVTNGTCTTGVLCPGMHFFCTVLIGYCDYLGTRQKNSHRLITVTGQ